MIEHGNWLDGQIWPNSSSNSNEFIDYLIQFMSIKHGIHLFEKYNGGKFYYTSKDDDFKIYMKHVNKSRSAKLKVNPWTLVLEEKKPFLVYDIVSNNFYPVDFKEYHSDDNYHFEWKSINLFHENLWDFHYLGSSQRFVFERKEARIKTKTKR